MKKTKIQIDVELDENHVPERIIWHAEDGGIQDKEAKAAMISMWDQKSREALRLDLWTKDMPMDEMKMFFHQIYVSLSETYKRATMEEDVAERMRSFAEEFAFHAKIRE